MIKMVKRSEKKETATAVSNDVPFIIRKMFNENGITDDKKISQSIRGK